MILIKSNYIRDIIEVMSIYYPSYVNRDMKDLIDNANTHDEKLLASSISESLSNLIRIRNRRFDNTKPMC